MNELMPLVQWPAMAVSVAAAWLVGSRHPGRRRIGFWLFLASNLLWGAWGLYSSAIALVVLQVCLAAMNLRVVKKADAGSEPTTGPNTDTHPTVKPKPTHSPP
jgi:hypothetical protein